MIIRDDAGEKKNGDEWNWLEDKWNRLATREKKKKDDWKWLVTRYPEIAYRKLRDWSLKQEEKKTEKIQEIAQQYNVPSWMARLYFDNQHITDDFLLSRKARMQEMFKGEVNHHLEEGINNEAPTDFTWKELYEVLLGGEEEIQEIHKWGMSIWEMLRAIDNILNNINSSSITKEGTLEFEVEVFEKKTEDPTSYIRGVEKSLFTLIRNSITRYLATEFPTNSNFSLNPFTKEKYCGYRQEFYTEMGNGGGYLTIYTTEITVCLKVKFSYSN